jgi:hypothetical protein
MENSKKQINHNRDADRLSIGANWICGDDILICDEMWEGGLLLFREKNEERRRSGS